MIDATTCRKKAKEMENAIYLSTLHSLESQILEAVNIAQYVVNTTVPSVHLEKVMEYLQGLGFGVKPDYLSIALYADKIPITIHW